jgi:hypothetical protein
MSAGADEVRQMASVLVMHPTFAYVIRLDMSLVF